MSRAHDKTRPIQFAGLRGLVITVSDLDRSTQFYQTALSMPLLQRGASQATLAMGHQSLTLTCADTHTGRRPAAQCPGSQHLKLSTDLPLVDVVTHLLALDVAIEDPPERRPSGGEPFETLSFRDPDGNLIEILGPVAE